jgi:hypothetical protein
MTFEVQLIVFGPERLFHIPRTLVLNAGSSLPWSFVKNTAGTAFVIQYTDYGPDLKRRRKVADRGHNLH